jgi:hypothetical protein
MGTCIRYLATDWQRAGTVQDGVDRLRAVHVYFRCPCIGETSVIRRAALRREYPLIYRGAPIVVRT